jgi:anti-sigma factor RsiW
MSNLQNSHPSTERLQAFLDGDVPSRERRRVEEHVASCAVCSEELATWRLLFEDLDDLRSPRPSVDFSDRVMSGVRLPAELPLAARVKGWLSAGALGRALGGAARPRARTTHLDAGVLQDLAEGILAARTTARAHTHLEGCATCSRELQSWTTVLASLSELDRFAPIDSFADRVIAGFEPSAVRVVTRRPALARAMAHAVSGARRFLPKTRRAWAALSGAAVTPAVTFGLVLYAVFSHPTLTPQALVSFTFWQITDLSVVAWNALVSGGIALAQTTGLDSLIDAMLGAPLVTAGGVAIYSVAFILATRVLYKNLTDSRSIRPRYASATAS